MAAGVGVTCRLDLRSGRSLLASAAAAAAAAAAEAAAAALVTLAGVDFGFALGVAVAALGVCELSDGCFVPFLAGVEASLPSFFALALPLAFGLGLSLAVAAGVLLLAAAAGLVLGLVTEAEGLGLDLVAFLAGGGDTTSTTLTSDLSDRVDEPVSRRLRFGVDALATDATDASNMISSF